MKAKLKKLNPARLLSFDFLELSSLTKGCETWDLEQFKTNPPRYYLLLRINALLKSLNIEINYKAFFAGSFLKVDDYSFEACLENIPVFKKMEFRHLELHYDKVPAQWAMVYERVMKHALLLNSAFQINSGVMLASGILRMGVFITDETNTKLWKAMQDEFNLLAWLINPKELSYTIEELNEQFEYPLIDLDKINIEWM